jgi:hypothetical protein
VGQYEIVTEQARKRAPSATMGKASRFMRYSSIEDLKIGIPSYYETNLKEYRIKSGVIAK